MSCKARPLITISHRLLPPHILSYPLISAQSFIPHSHKFDEKKRLMAFLVTYILCGLVFHTMFVVVYSALSFTLAEDDTSSLRPPAPRVVTTNVPG